MRGPSEWLYLSSIMRAPIPMRRAGAVAMGITRSHRRRRRRITMGMLSFVINQVNSRTCVPSTSGRVRQTTRVPEQTTSCPTLPDMEEDRAKLVFCASFHRTWTYALLEYHIPPVFSAESRPPLEWTLNNKHLFVFLAI
jgi:hypothetical protein